MKKLRWQIVIVALALVAIAVLLLSQQPVVQTDVPRPSEGGLYIEGLVGTIGRLNPLLDSYNRADRDIDRLIYSSLIQFDAKGNPYPDLAESWGISIDGLVYNIKLRPNAVWHDGTPVTTDDVVFTIELLRDPEMPISADVRSLWEEVEVNQFDEWHIQFRLPAAYAPFLSYLHFGILPQHLLAGMSAAEIIDAQFNMAPVGSGPYKFEELLIEDGQIAGVVLQAFDDYYKERAFIDQVVFRYFEDVDLALAAYQNGEILGISQITTDILEEVLADQTLSVYSGIAPQLSLVLLNLDNDRVPYFQDEVVRRALLTGINRDWIVGRILDGQGVIAHSPVFPGSWAYKDDVESIPYEPEEAVALLKSAGYIIPASGGNVRVKDEVRMSFELVHPDTLLHTQIAEAIQEDWARIGVQVILIAVDYDTLMQKYVEPRKYEAALVDINLADTPDPDPYPFWHQALANTGQNYADWNDRRASEYLEQARVIARVAERARLYKNFQVHFARQVPALLLYYPTYSFAVSVKVQGVQVGPLFESADRFDTMTTWFLVAGGGGEDSPEIALPVIEE